MKTVIVPDVHQQLEFVQSILEREKDAKYIWLGDIFDDYEDTPDDAARTAQWLNKRVLSNPEDEFLLGNHDAWYLWPTVTSLRCSGNTATKAAAIRDCLDVRSYIDRVKLWTFADTWLLSHAGFSQEALTFLSDNTLYPHEAAKADVLESLKHLRVHPLLQAGVARGGPADKGGINWLDFNWEFEPLAGINQIFGHTRANEPRWKNTEDSSNLCLDTHLHHYAVLEDGKVTVKENI